MSLTVAQANAVARELDARMNADGDRALSAARIALSPCGGCYQQEGTGRIYAGEHYAACPQSIDSRRARTSPATA